MSFFRANLIGLKADRDKKEIGNYQRRAASARFEARHYQKRNKFKFSYSRRAREISAFVARIVVLYKLKMQYHAHPSAMPMWYNVREDGA